MKPINPSTVGQNRPLEVVCKKIGCPNTNMLNMNYVICSNCILLTYNAQQRSKLRRFLGAINEAD